jgi:nucleoside-diphosphate-sugar epimerase
MKRILVTGAAGRLGRRVIPALLERGYEVRALIHKTPLTTPWSGDVAQVRAGVEDADALAEAVHGADAICHLAALMPPTPDDVLFETNIRGTYLLLQAAARDGRPRFLFASSDATYCTGWSLDPYASAIDENTPLRPVLFYGITKSVGEQMCVNYQDAYRIPMIRLRFPTILEPREALDLFLSAPYKELLAPEEAGRWDAPGTVKMALEADGQPFVEHVVDTRDAAQGVLLAVEKESAVNQAFNIAGPAPFTYAETGPLVAARLGVEAIPGRCKGLYSFELSIQKARGMLGYRPRFGILDSLEEAYSQTAAAGRG